LKISRYKSYIVVIFSILAFSCSHSYALDIVKQVTDGVTLTQTTNDNPSYPLLTNTLSINLAQPDLKVKAALGKDAIYTDDLYKGRENVAAMVERKNAIAGINADFFPMEWGGDPLGVCIVDGELVSEPAGNRAAIAFTRDRKVIFDIPTCIGSLVRADGSTVKLDGINKPRGTGQVIAYTSAFGVKIQSKFAATYARCTSADLPVAANKPVKLTVTEILPDILDVDIQPDTVLIAGGGESAKLIKDGIKVGDTLTMRFDLSSPSGCDWSTVDQAVGGGPWLVKDGIESIDGDAEGFGADIVKATHPRTAIGITADNRLLMVTVDGRQDISKGLSLADMASQMRRLGAVTAINLDGGGSTTLSIRGFVVNSPSGGTERYVADGLLLFSDKTEPPTTDSLGIAGIGDTIIAGEFAHLTPVLGPDSNPIPEADLNKVIWGSKSGMGFVDQMGRYSPTKTKTGAICASYGALVTKRTIKIDAGPADKLTLKLTPDATDTTRAMLKITSIDKLGNPTADRPITLTITGGTADTGTLLTDTDGKYATTITWAPDAIEQAVEVTIDKTKATTKPVVAKLN